MKKVQALVEALAAKLYQGRRKGATLVLCLIAIWVAYHVVFGANGTMVYAHKREEHRALNKEIQELKQENEQLTNHVDALKNDPRTIEKEAREQLRYARPGEVIYTLPQPTRKPSTFTAEKR
ncbi:MAG: septation ring formation regulator EzrA [Acidobacteria bacterium]|nr:MAG: septation ring formation regulator EzrA [Acidobacteriota bacterium]